MGYKSSRTGEQIQKSWTGGQQILHEQVEPEEEEGGIVDNGDEDGSQQPGPSSNRLAEEEEEDGDQVPLYINDTNRYQDQASAKYKLQEAGLYKYKWLLKSKLFPKSVAWEICPKIRRNSVEN